VLKRAADRDIVEACRAAMRGETFIYPASMKSLFACEAEQVFARDRPPAPMSLTPRETEITKLVAEGHTSIEIAELLVISSKTVDRHRANILAKLGLRDRTDLTRYAIRQGLAEP
jgi:DNA-binding NarL/FixJ family response regulator